jgi:hypothetical protein
MPYLVDVVLNYVNVFVLQQHLVSRFMVSTVDESASSSSLVGSMSSPLCSTVSADPSVILRDFSSLALSKQNMHQIEVKCPSNDRAILGEVETHSIIYSDTEGNVSSTGKKVAVGRENLSNEDIRKQSSASADTIPTFSLDANYDLNSSESHSQHTEVQGTQSEISMSSSTDVYSSKRSSIVDPDVQLGLLEIDTYMQTMPEPSTQDHIMASNGQLTEGTSPQLSQTRGHSGTVLAMNGTQLEQDVKNMTITHAVHDTQLSDLSGSEGPSRKTSFISERSTEFDEAMNITAQIQKCVSEAIPSCQSPAEPHQLQHSNVQTSSSLACQITTSQVMPGASHTPNQQYTPENTIMPAVDQQALLMHPRLSQQNSLEKDR